MTRRNQIFRRILLTTLGVFFVALFLPFYQEVLLAIFFAFALDPLTRRLSEHHFFHRRGWVAVTLAGLILLVALPVGVATFNIYSVVEETTSGGVQNSRTFKDFATLKGALVEQANRAIRTFKLERQLDPTKLDEKVIAKAGEKAMALSAAIVAGLPNLTISLFIFCSALYFFLAESRRLRRLAEGTRLMPQAELTKLIAVLRAVCRSILVASMVVGGIQAVIVATGAVVFGAGDFFVIFVVTFFLSFIPVVGAAPVAFALALISVLRQEYGNAIGLSVIGIVAGSIDNIIRPWIVGGEENVHPVIVLLAIIGGIAIFGLAGLFLGPLIASITLRVFAFYVFHDEEALELPAKTKAKVST